MINPTAIQNPDLRRLMEAMAKTSALQQHLELVAAHIARHLTDELSRPCKYRRSASELRSAFPQKIRTET